MRALPARESILSQAGCSALPELVKTRRSSRLFSTTGIYKPWLQEVIWSAIELPKPVVQYPLLEAAGFACKQNAAGMNIVLMNNALTPAALLQQLTVVQEDQLYC